ncbi:bifunctional 2-polyprenyl-6-hydroxyphenol methylase/3-demethylubiquinol 3-O-methyltransferase UbiG [Psittacicella hinzii]|uniref:Ubiquinone biosynthesis O-methyltransferase n=1 Tax=Psittacicella hinzii TaxID=2028575 RepID=A0A3A1YCP2_9GAMM|nr:bifunctional 2-polyprenyl-6-hydroxyphenol methylase/3-demethylubiquinol 3-O-methyltransferase UbiG [Psittacicella hinzii]RIY34989.1 hypothetical protein CKF58_07250 [Psittacicella hinzii]
MTQNKHKANVDANEIAKFSQMAGDWWDLNGSFKLIHRLNPTRLAYVQQQALAQGIGSLVGKKVLDLGCGAGILAHALALQGAVVTGIDMAEQALEAGKAHAQPFNLSNLNYELITAEDFAQQHAGTFDVVCCMEMVEHVPDYSSILAAAAKILKPQGLLVMSTINRTWQAQLQIIEAVENYLKWLPRGTHEYQKFIKPAELITAANKFGLEAVDATGYKYNLFTQKFFLSDNLDVNYLVSFVKRA